MAEQTTQEALLVQTETQPTPNKPKQPRQFVRFTFFKLDP
ncbi:MAG TPA: chlorite dismutase, partial [Ktedonobacter sp.]|nr:chlorite dismutase [Ktedonobacter sp.]